MPTGLATRGRVCALGAARSIGRGVGRDDDRDGLGRVGVRAETDAALHVEPHDVGEGVVRWNRISSVYIGSDSIEICVTF